MSQRTRWIASLLILGLGAAALVASRCLEDSESWWSSALLEVGAAIFLLLPLLFFERLFERRVERVEERAREDVETVRREVATVQAALGDLQVQTEARVAERRRADREAVARARQDVSRENISALVAEAKRLDAVSSAGPRVPVAGGWPRIKFEHLHLLSPGADEPEEQFWISVVDVRGRREGPNAVWEPGEGAPEVFARLIESWQAHGSYPGDGFLDADRIFGDLIDALAMAIERRRGEGALGPLIELTSEHWALTDAGIEHLGSPHYTVEATNIVNEPEQVRDHMLDKTWVLEHEQEFRGSFQVARMYHSGPEAERVRRTPRFPLG